MNAITTTAPAQHTPIQQNPLIPRTMDEAMRLADMMARGKMVPKHCQGDPGTCLMIIEQAGRWNMSPFAVAQCTSNIGGKLCYEGKLIAAVIPACGGIVGEFDYEYTGDPKKPETLSVTCRATRASDGKVKEITLSWKDARTENKYWTLQPEQQLCYAASRVWARRWTPGPLLGVNAPEEFAGITVDGTAEPLPEPAAQPPETTEAAPRKPTVAEWLGALEADLQAAQTADEVDAIVSRQDVQAALDKLRNGSRDRLNALVKAALDRTADDFPGVVTPQASWSPEP